MEERFRARTPRSRQLFSRALLAHPGGDTRSGTFYRPYPAFMQSGSGCRLRDVDGNEYIDFLNNYTSLVHGHAHPEILRAIAAQARRGTVHGAPVEAQIELADAITGRLSSVERVRFTNSGTEAVLNTLRLARAVTGRSKVLKMEGGYHGSYDAAEVSVDPGADPPAFPEGRPDGPGLSPGLTAEVLVGPFNDLDTTAELVHRHRDELAAVIVEPVMNAAGMIPAEAAFLQGIRRATQENDILLIFDEVVTLRLDPGGAQALYQVAPDLTALGKVIGGGLPVGAFGGSAALMGRFDPQRPDAIFHSGTYNGNALTAAAGAAAMRLLDASAIDRINDLGERLRERLQQALDGAADVVGTVTGVGSVAHIHFAEAPVRDYRCAARGDREVFGLLHLALLSRGIFTASRGMFCISTPMGEEEVDRAVAAFAASLSEVAPVARARLPERRR